MAAAETLVRGLARLLQDAGDLVLDGSSTLTLLTSTLQHLTQVFEQHLGSRNQNRGFVALPSHPAETAAILQAQFLFDVLQKTHSLKLVHVPNCVLQSAVKIFPFKSLRHLELKSVPPHCLRGLRFVYSQLESLTCCKCISTLEEIISACGGDLSCALPWLELQTVNFSYNSITALDDSLQLLNALRVLDLSHNKIQDCEHYLTTLTELEYLNLAYNFLSKVPALGIFSRSKLVTLILRNNELDSINGVEQLVNLQHLDVAYNLLLEHAQLAPLSTLHCLKKLYLEGNPIWFHQNHRSAALVHVSPRAAFSNFFLDGEPLSSSDLMHLPRLVQSVSQSIHTSTSEKTALDRSALESSCAADFSDSQSPSENVAVKVSRKKSKGKVKVRRASISEPSDTEHEPQALPLSAGLVLEHQKEMKRLASFRDRFGADWLQYKRHLEEHDQVPVMSHSHSAEEITGTPAAMDQQSESSDPEQGKPQVSQEEGSSPPLDDTAKEEEPEVQLDEPMEGEQREEEVDELMLGEEEDEKVEVDLCQPVLVSQIEGEGDPEPEWIFLRVTAKHVIEVELKAARVLHKLELKCLKNVETSELTWKRMDLERVFPVLTLHFSYIRKDRQKRRYVVLDDCPEQCLQCILEVLSPAVEENRRNQDQEKGSMKLQCLKCKQEFSQSLPPWHQGSYSSELGDTKILETLVATGQAAGEPIACPSCSSDHVVILPSEECSSTPLLPGADSTSEDLSDSVLEGGSQQEGPEEMSVLATGSGQFYIGGEDSSEIDTSNSARSPELSAEPEPGSTLHPTCRGSEGGSGKEQGVKSQSLSLSHPDTSGGSLVGSCRHSASRGPTPSPLSVNSESEETWNLSPSLNSVLNTRDFHAVDHRLKLYLDMEVFEENAEEFQCFLKVVIVKFGRPGEFLSILVASDLKIYVLEVTGAIRGQPADWLKKNDSHYLSDISHLEVGLCHQTLRMEFENPKTSYNLLIRNQSCCDQFLQTLTDLMQELPAKHRSKVKEIPTVEMNPQHWLWPLLDSKSTDSAAADDTCFFYLLAYLIQGASAFPVTLLSTRSMLFLLEENHQWQVQPSLDEDHEAEMPPRSNMQLKEKQPITSISNIITYRLCPCDIKLMLYDEVLKLESTWHIRTECPELLVELVEWIRGPWEEMFSIELRKAVHEALE
ncbi:serine/threonine-protein kinase 11-interacting protein isoform X1 [Ammospiza nelsoni]|uniref:serine/threonine-protein kinase 11-interacting protein isoform X1 n=1 Tax=Ammospiza caudacuta TaxID=2857398 RepID=UPI002739166C|nr:serine/threonine-protein kinase 11-interacting protein isoform X1 [Ammospiza caudacuta]XP_059331793.1 serine/threonine-protein kinase 11-interacting protein isoform X1 [Ammospiza nelsoni]